MPGSISDDVIIPAELEEMTRRISDSSQTTNERHKSYLDYVAGWLLDGSRSQYKELITRDGIPDDPRVVKLLCELAVMRALVRWHEVRDRPPPMPTISNL